MTAKASNNSLLQLAASTIPVAFSTCWSDLVLKETVISNDKRTFFQDVLSDIVFISDSLCQNTTVQNGLRKSTFCR